MNSGARSEEPIRLGPATIDTANLRHALDVDGYVIVRDVVDKLALTELGDRIAAEYQSVAATGQLFDGGGALSGHLNCFPGEGSRFVYDALVEKGIVDAIRAIRPDIADAVRPTLNLNLANSHAQHFHVDSAFLKEFLICNIAVVDTDLINGAIDVLPGTNREFLPFWRYALRRTYRLSTRLPLHQGDLLIRKSNLWHRGMPNRSGTARPMMAVTFGEVADDGHDPFQLNGGDIAFYPNWFKPTALGRLRERIFVRAPITYSSYRFMRSLDGKKGYESF